MINAKTCLGWFTLITHTFSNAPMADPADAIVVLITAGSKEEAVRLADALVVAHLAACVQILPAIESVYHWEGRVERSGEILILAKTTRGNFQALEAAVRALHSYQAPEIIALEVTVASATYLEWLTSNVIPQTREVNQEGAGSGGATPESR